MGGLILILEDEQLLARNMKVFLTSQGHDVLTADTVARALQLYDEQQPDLILADHNLPDGTGLDVITNIRARDRQTRLVMITAHGGVDLAVAAMKAGANDYLTKPVSLDEIALLVNRLMAQLRLEGAVSAIRARDERQNSIDRIIGTAPAILAMKKKIRMINAADRAAAADDNQPGPPVLILGETGTGKELVARALHYDSPRAAQPFIAVNCAALPEQLVESELFGHERGAFTGANEKRVGLFQAAEGGTLFLDEIGELPLAQQAKLLKVLEDRVIRPVGSTRDRKISVRFVAATNAAIEDRARSGEFRSDLLYRLNTVTLDIPPLRERGEDAVTIAESFLAEFERRYGRAQMSLSPRARRAISRHSWPGNIRELRNVIEQACLMCPRDIIEEDDLTLRDVPPLVNPTPAADSARPANLAEVERNLIIGALRREAGNVTTAARALGISRDTLRYRMEKLALRREDYL